MGMKVGLYFTCSADDFTAAARKVGLEQTVINAFFAAFVHPGFVGCHEDDFTEILRALNVHQKTIEELHAELRARSLTLHFETIDWCSGRC